MVGTLVELPQAIRPAPRPIDISNGSGRIAKYLFCFMGLISEGVRMRHDSEQICQDNEITCMIFYIHNRPVIPSSHSADSLVGYSHTAPLRPHEIAICSALPAAAQ